MSTDDLDPCEVCKAELAEPMFAGFDGIHQACPRCGAFKVSGTALAALKRLTPRERAKLSAWIFEQNRHSVPPMISTENLAHIISMPLPSVGERAVRLLSEAAKNQAALGEQATGSGLVPRGTRGNGVRSCSVHSQTGSLVRSEVHAAG